MNKERNRVVIEAVSPEIDGGRFPAKRVVGEGVRVEADIIADGHDVLDCLLLYRAEGDAEWTEVRMEPLVNDRYYASFVVVRMGLYRYTIQAWVDRFLSWRKDIVKRIDAEQDNGIDYLTGAALVEDGAARAAAGPDAGELKALAAVLRDPGTAQAERRRLALDPLLQTLMARHPDRRLASAHEKELVVAVDRERARFSSWYEVFPRSCAAEPGKHGTFQDCEHWLPYVAEMGFDVLYFPPIHPIGNAFRKGKNNVTRAEPGDVGSPWGIGSKEGGHKSIHPELGTLEDFRRLVEKAKQYGIEIALDIAYQCSPEHPYVTQHSEWFHKRPDGSIQYAENPPKKYQDIYPVDLESPAWRETWQELKSVILFWIDQGVHIFRVDNPHTKPFPFWEWLIGEIKRDHPETLFLAEAFTRPKIVYRLAKLGFTQSYTYFAWRNTKRELTQYFRELYQSDVREFFRPNLWPNTPDILTEYLQHGGRPAFLARLILAATLGASYGIYGPAFELCENQPREPGSEEYLNSEKYELKHWEIDRPDSLKEIIALVNRIRRENPALQQNCGFCVHDVDNDELICYSKTSQDGSNIILVVVNLDPHHTQSGWVDLRLEVLGVHGDRPYQVHDLLTGARYLWHGPRNYVQLDPGVVPAHIFTLRRRVLTEEDFDYYM